MTELETLPLPDGRTLKVEAQGERLTLADARGPLVQASVLVQADTLTLSLVENPEENCPGAMQDLAYWAFSAHPACQAILWQGLPAGRAHIQDLTMAGVLTPESKSGAWQTRREALWQQPLWLTQACATGFPEVQVMENNIRFPVRPPKPEGEVYRRYDAALGSWISFRTLDVSTDLERFNRWQNRPRVNEFWEEANTLEGHRTHLHNLAADPHCLQLIGCFDDEPFGFFDAYWAREDRIGPWCDAGFYDRGIHMLVGEDHHRGPHKVACWLPSLVHYLFLDEPRTNRIVSEPRSDNDRMIGHLMNTGFSRLRDFNFPHKRAALMSLARERFFDHCVLR